MKMIPVECKLIFNFLVHTLSGHDSAQSRHQSLIHAYQPILLQNCEEAVHSIAVQMCLAALHACLYHIKRIIA